MRNLKRALSLGLTAAMISGLMVMGSSAASYADVTSENNVEAIEVLQAVGVMIGDEDGNFNPDENVTRNEMAVIMSNLLALNVSNFTSSSIPFTDVPDWAAPYVTACYADGITSGTSDTTYGGSDTVTAAQAGLMMLKALGYFQYSSDFGSDWQLAAVRQASSIDLYDGIDAGASSAMTRNEVAQIALNALEATMVEPSSDGSTIVVGDITVSSNVSYDERTGSNSKYEAINPDNADDSDTQYTIELGEELYDGDLEKNESDPDVFGRPAVQWEYNNSEIGTYADDPEESYTEAMEKDALYDLIGSSVYNDLEDGDYELNVYIDGEPLTDEEVEADSLLEAFIVRNDDDDAEFTGRGVLTQVYVDDDLNTVTITLIHTYVAQVDGDYDEDNEELELAALDGTMDIPADTLTLSSDDFDNLDQFADEDYVLLTVADSEVQTIEAVEAVTATVTAYTVGSSVTADGTRYYYNETYTKARNDNRTESVTYDLNDDYTLILDSYGYVVYSDGSEGVEDYVYVTDMAYNGGVRSDLEAEAYFMDGTNSVITIDNDEDFDEGDSGWYLYDEQNDGDYELTEVDETTYGGDFFSSNSTAITETGSTRVYYSSSNYARANSSTIFVVNDDDDVAVYTGINEVPDITARGSVLVAVVMDGTYADAVYIDATEATIAGMSDDRVYILDATPDASTDSDDNDYYEYDAIVNGEVGTVMTTDDNYEVGLYTDVSYDENDYVDDMERVTNTTKYEDFLTYTYSDEGENIEYDSGVISIGSDDIVLADSYTIFFNDDGDAETWTASKLEREYDDVAFAGYISVFENDDDQAVEIYVTPDTDASEEEPGEEDTYTVDFDITGVDADASEVLLINGEAYTEDSLTITESEGITFTVEPAEGYSLESVTCGDATVNGRDDYYVVTVPAGNSDVTVEVTAAENSYSIALETAGYTMTGEETISAVPGSTATVTITAEEVGAVTENVSVEGAEYTTVSATEGKDAEGTAVSISSQAEYMTLKNGYGTVYSDEACTEVCDGFKGSDPMTVYVIEAGNEAVAQSWTITISNATGDVTITVE